DSALRSLRRGARGREARVGPRSDRRAAQGPDAPGGDLVTGHVVVGGLLRLHGGRELVRRVPFLDRRLGQLQGLGRHRPVPPARARAGSAAGAPRLGANAVKTVASPTASTTASRPASTEDIRQALASRLASFAPSVIEIRDDSAAHAGHAGAAGGAGHFSVTI